MGLISDILRSGGTTRPFTISRTITDATANFATTDIYKKVNN
jgi:hypothetical protein